LIIATGVKDIKPKITNFDKFDGNGAWHCPYCDGLEAAGRTLAIIVSGKDSLSYVKEFLGWTRDIIMFPYGNSIHIKEKEEADVLGIKIIQDKIKSIEGELGKLPKQLICEGGKHYTTNVIFYRLGYQLQNKLAVQLGCQLDDGYIKVDQKQETTIPNTYAAGDIDTDRHYVILASAAGARAAISIYEKILKDAVEAELKSKNRE
jgi:thioredoxin reductase